MARYIDAEELYKRVKDNVGAYYASQVDVKDECLEEIENMPTADVVPKSEVAAEVIDDLAREGLLNVEPWAIAELKKKYTEGKK
jgi:hypothetical protein